MLLKRCRCQEDTQTDWVERRNRVNDNDADAGNKMIM